MSTPLCLAVGLDLFLEEGCDHGQLFQVTANLETGVWILPSGGGVGGSLQAAQGFEWNPMVWHKLNFSEGDFRKGSTQTLWMASFFILPLFSCSFYVLSLFFLSAVYFFL